MFMVLTVRSAASTLRGMDDLGLTLNAMDSTRLLLALLFVAGYASAIGRMASERGRRFSIALALLAVLAFVGLTDPWVNGALLVVFVVVGVGGFVALAWAFSAWAVRLQAAGVALAPPATPAVERARTAPAILISRSVRRLRRRLSTL